MSAPLLSRVKSELSPRHALCSLSLPAQATGAAAWKVDEPVAASIPASVVAVADPSVTGVVIFAVDAPKHAVASISHRQSESALRQLKVAHCSADQRLLAMQWSHSETQPVLALLLQRDQSSSPALVLHGDSDQTASVATNLPSPFPCSASAPSAGLSLWWGARQGHSLIGVTSVQGAAVVFNAAGQMLWQHTTQGPHHSIALDPSLSILATQSGSIVKGLPLPDSMLQGLEPPTHPVHAGWTPHSALQCTAAAHGGFFVTSAVRRSDSQVSALTVLDLTDVAQPNSRSFQFPIEYGLPVTHHLLPSLLLSVTSGGLLLAMSPQTGSIAYRLQLTAPDHPFESLPLSASHRWDPNVTRAVTCARVNPLQPQLIAVVWDRDDVQIVDVNDWARVHLSFPLVTAAVMNPSASVTSVDWCCGGHAVLVRFEADSTSFARVYPVPDLSTANPAVVSCTLHAFPVYIEPHYSTATVDPLAKTITVPALLPRLRFQDIASASTTTGPAIGSAAPVPNACLRLVVFPAPSRTAQTIEIPLNVDPVSEASLSALLPAAESKLSEDLKSSVALTERLVAFVHPSSDLAASASEAARLVLPRWQPRRLLVILNPFAGKRQGKDVLKAAMPIFEAAGMAVTVIETKDCNTATETAKTMDINAFDAIVCVSGDSTVTQIINGLYSRPDRERALKMPVSLLPAGSSNALAVSFDSLQAEVTALRIVRGETRLLDMFRLKHGATDRLVLVDVAFGIVGDVNAKSERLRWMGPVRYDVSGMLGILKLKPYRCNVSYLPPSAEQLALRAKLRAVGAAAPDSDETAIKNGAAALEIKCRPNCQYCEQMQAIVKYESESKLAGAEAPADEWVHLPENQEWLSIFSCNQSWVTKTMQFTPYAHMSDGLIDLVLSLHSSKMAALKLFTALPSAGHIQDEECFYLQARAFRLEGMYPQKAKLNIDGEVLDLEGDHPLIVEVLPSFCTYLGGW